MAYVILGSMSIVEVSACFIFLRKNLSRRQVCITTNIITSAGVYSVLMLNCGIIAAAMIVNYSWTMVQYKKHRSVIRLPNAPNTSSELNRAILISLGIYICLYLPSVFTGFILYFYEVPHMLILFDVPISLLNTTTTISPFVYYATMKDFRQGYKNILLCKTRKENQNQQIELAVIDC